MSQIVHAQNCLIIFIIYDRCWSCQSFETESIFYTVKLGYNVLGYNEQNLVITNTNLLKYKFLVFFSIKRFFKNISNR